jgi:hypothetical protein
MRPVALGRRSCWDRCSAESGETVVGLVEGVPGAVQCPAIGLEMTAGRTANLPMGTARKLAGVTTRLVPIFEFCDQDRLFGTFRQSR